MNAAAFPSPTAEMAEMNRLQYELEYTEGISQSMRIPEMLKVAPQGREDSSLGSQEVPHSVIMQIPERIVIADNNDAQFPTPRDRDLSLSTPRETLSLKPPPRVLTLSDWTLDFLEEDQRAPPDSEELLRPQAQVRPERSASENTAARHSSQLIPNDSGLALSTYEAALDTGPDDMTVVDATTLRRQICKLSWRVQCCEEENKKLARGQKVLCSVTAVLWLFSLYMWWQK